MARKEANAQGRHEALRLVRPRTLLYAGMLVGVGLVMLAGWLNRSILEVNVLAERNPPFVLLSDGSMRNAYTVKILNKLHQARAFEISARGLGPASLSVVGNEPSNAATVTVPTDSLGEFRVLVALPKASVGQLDHQSTPFDLVVTDVVARHTSKRSVTFRSPGSATGRQP